MGALRPDPPKASIRLLAVEADSILLYWQEQYPMLPVEWHRTATVNTVRYLIHEVTPTHTWVKASGGLEEAFDDTGIPTAKESVSFEAGVRAFNAQECYVAGYPSPERARIAGLAHDARLFFVPGPIPYGARSISPKHLADYVGGATLSRLGCEAIAILASEGVDQRVWRRFANELDTNPRASANHLGEIRSNYKREVGRDAAGILERHGFFSKHDSSDRPSPPSPSATRVEVGKHLPELQVKSFARDYKLVDNDDTLHELLGLLGNSPTWGVDTETTGLHPRDSSNLGLVIAPVPGQSYYFGDAYDEPFIDERVRRALADPRSHQVYHNWTFDSNRMRQFGIPVRGRVDDTLVMGHLLGRRDTTGRIIKGKWVPGELNLKALTLYDLGYKMITFEDITEGSKTLEGYDPADVVAYACADADMTLQLYYKYRGEFDDDVWGVYEDIERPLFDMVPDMVWNGLNVDLDRLADAAEEIEVGVDAAIEQLWNAIKGYGIVTDKADIPKFMNSPQKKSKLLFEELGLPKTQKRKSGYSTAKDDLELIAYADPVVGYMLDYGSVKGLKEKFTDAIPEHISQVTGRIHPGVNQVGTDTGRFSMNNPNAHQLPGHSDLGLAIRDAIVASPGHKLVGADWSQIEVRIMAAESGDPVFIEAFQKGIDVYSAVAADFYHIDLEDVDKEEHRQPSKAIVLGANYGLGETKLARSRRISRPEARAFIDEYFIRHPHIAEYQENKREFARVHGYIETEAHRRRPTPQINNRTNIARRMQDERVAINMPIQGYSADILKMALAEVDKQLGWVYLQVHDEVILNVPEDLNLNEVSHELEHIMCNIVELKNGVPIVADAKVGYSWRDVK